MLWRQDVFIWANEILVLLLVMSFERTLCFTTHQTLSRAHRSCADTQGATIGIFYLLRLIDCIKVSKLLDDIALNHGLAEEDSALLTGT